MQNADTLLRVIRQRGQCKQPLERVYRLLFNRELYLIAYGRIARNAGAMTPGSTAETVDGMSLAKIDRIIDLLRFERYRWTPARRVYIEKKRSTKRRPLGLPPWSDKLLQEVIRLILDAYYEPQFSPASHGFRPQRGCHTALHDIHHTWTGTTWFIEGDIAQCFDTLDHTVLIAILATSIHDNRFLRLIRELLQAGYLENWTYTRTLSGTPQGGVVSPLLANIYLNQLDTFVETTLIPQYTQGTRRRIAPAYNRVMSRAHYLMKTGHQAAGLRMRKQAQAMPALDPMQPGYRRLRYVRYADDFLLGFVGPRSEAEDIKQRLGTYLHETLKLALSTEKTLITHAKSSAARFLGYAIRVQKNDRKRDRRGQRSLNGTISLRVPPDVIKTKCRSYMAHGSPRHRPEMEFDAVFSIIAHYQQEYRGMVNYYHLAMNRSTHLAYLRWVMELSLVKTLAQKLKISVSQVYSRYKTRVQTPEGPRVALQVSVPRVGKPPLVATWGGLSLKRQATWEHMDDPQPAIFNTQRTELVQRLLADECELCGARDSIQVHHIRALRDLQKRGRTPKPAWVMTMAARRRKTLIVCQRCHMDIHHGRVTGP
jgi:group II intron reverse transcriptase/maturase